MVTHGETKLTRASQLHFSIHERLTIPAASACDLEQSHFFQLRRARPVHRPRLRGERRRAVRAHCLWCGETRRVVPDFQVERLLVRRLGPLAACSAAAGRPAPPVSRQQGTADAQVARSQLQRGGDPGRVQAPPAAHARAAARGLVERRRRPRRRHGRARAARLQLRLALAPAARRPAPPPPQAPQEAQEAQAAFPCRPSRLVHALRRFSRRRDRALASQGRRAEWSARRAEEEQAPATRLLGRLAL